MKRYIYIIILLLSVSYGYGQTTVTIGSSGGNSWYSAFSGFYGYHRSANLYTSAEVGSTGIVITSLQFNVQETPTSSLPIKIYLKTTSSTTLSTDTWSNITSGATLVYDATEAFGSTGWTTIDIDDFTYSSDNLLILCESNYGSSGTFDGQFYYTTAASKHQQWYQDNSAPTGNGTVNGLRSDIKITYSSAPSITTSAVSSIAPTTATGNATITSIGGSAVTVSGVCWNTSTGPTTANSKTTDGATTATTFTTSMTGLAAQTYYYVKAYATNSSGTAYGSEVNFWTYSTEPTGHSATFTATLNGNSQIDLAFSAASGYGADGYIILRRTSAAPTSGGVVDGTAPGSLSLSDATLVTTITSNATTSYSNTGLLGGTTYYYIIIPYNYDGSNNETYNYYIAATIPGANATTPEFYSSKGLAIAGDFTNNGTFIQSNDNNYYIMNGTSKTLSGSGTFTDAKLYVDGTIAYNGTSTSEHLKTMINTSKTYTVNASKTYYNHDIFINGTTIMSASSGIMNSGNWTNDGTFTMSTSTITFNGSSAQTIEGSVATSFYDLTINNTSGDVTLAIDATASHALTLTSGKVYTVDKTLTLGTTSANATVSGGSSSTYVVAYDNGGTIGYLKHFLNSNATYTYPVGDASDYTPISFTLSSNGGLSNAYITSYTKPSSIPGLNTSFTTYLTRYWSLEQSGITSPTYDVSYSYVNTDITGVEANLLPIKKSGTTWYKPTGSNYSTGTIQGNGSVNTGTNTLTWTGLSTFSFYSGVGDQAIPLPIELVTFDAKLIDNQYTELKWITASEINNDYFTIEKSQNGIFFEELETIKGAGNSNLVLNYLTFDRNPFNEITYYRLKQTNFDGVSSLSNIVSVKKTIEQLELSIFPNPNKGSEFNLKGFSNFTGGNLSIFNQNGSLIENVQVPEDLIIHPSKTLTPGIYFIHITSNEINTIQKMIVY